MAHNPYGAAPGSAMDDIACLLNGFAKRCKECRKPTMNKWLTGGQCPACTGAKVEGHRDFGSNGGIHCDVSSGPCSCGAWH